MRVACHGSVIWQASLALVVLGFAGCGGTIPAIPAGPRAAAKAAPAKVVAPAAPPVATPEPAPAAALPKWAMSPGKSRLQADDDGIQFVVTEPGPLGEIDRTAEATWTAEPEGLVSVEPSGYVRPLKAGAVTVRAKGKDGQLAEATLEVDARENRPWDFATDVLPVLTRAGCNTGGCHGKADGQNGFHLSLFGYDPEGDHEAITRGAQGRRVSTLDPDSSLLLLKATGQAPHKGGQRFPVDSDSYRTLSAWLEAGAPKQAGRSHGGLETVTVEPANVRLDGPGERQLRVVARFRDGHERDVTRLTTFTTRDESALSVNDQGRAKLLRRAESDLMARFRTEVMTGRISTVINPDLKFDFTKLPRTNPVDREVFQRLEELRVPPSPRSSDAAFLRRVSLDLTGQQPLPDEIRAFVKDEDPEKRAKLVDRLLSDRLFIKFWKLKVGDLLQVSQARVGNGRGQYEDWIERSLAKDVAWDAMVTQLLTALGNPSDPTSGGPVNYALDGMDAREQAELAAQRFLGQRFRCAQCHDHPFDVWTQDDYYGLAAFFAKVRRGQPAPQAGMRGMNVVSVDPDGKVEHLRTKKPAAPRLPKGDPVSLEPTDDPRKALAAWMTSPENPYFARAAANWVWSQFFGKGIADPPDDLSRANPPVHPALLDALAKDLAEHKFDLKHLIRTITTSEVYGLSSATLPGNEQDTRLFSHHIPRPLTAHQMADALAQATDTVNRFDIGRGSGNLVERKAVEISDPSIPSVMLDTFGRCARTNGCSPVATPTLSLRQSLLLIGGHVIDDRIEKFDGYLSSLLEFESDPSSIVENLYLRTLCRWPTSEETTVWTAELSQAKSLREASEDLFWALLNSREFAFNH